MTALVGGVVEDVDMGGASKTTFVGNQDVGTCDSAESVLVDYYASMTMQLVRGGGGGTDVRDTEDAGGYSGQTKWYEESDTSHYANF